MKLEQSFEVDAPLERVWQTLIDVEHVAPCLPGAAVTGRNDDGSYNGTFTVKIGPTTASYTGRLEMETIDEGSHTATMQAQGTDKRGQGGAKATIYSRLAPVDGRGTRVEVVTDYHITGRLARFGRGGMIEDISERLLREFAKRLQSSLVSQQDTIVSTAPEPAVPAGEPEAPVAPVAEPQEAMRDHTVFAPVPTDNSPSEAPASPVGDVTPPPPPPAEPITPPQPWSQTPEPSAAVPEPTDAASGPSPLEPPEPPAPVAPQPSPAADAGTAAAPEPPAPPPPPSPGPPPVATPPPAPSTPPVGERPPLQHPPQPSEPMQGLSLVGGVVWSRVKRNPAPAAAAGVAVMLLLARRRRRRR